MEFKTKLNLKICPNSNKNSIKNIEDNLITINIKEAAEKNKANIELIKYLSKIFRIDKDDIRLVVGLTSTNKVVEIRGRTYDEIIETLKEKL